MLEYRSDTINVKLEKNPICNTTIPYEWSPNNCIKNTSNSLVRSHDVHVTASGDLDRRHWPPPALVLPALALRRARAHRAPEPRQGRAPSSLFRLLPVPRHNHGASPPAAAAPPPELPHPHAHLALRLLVPFRAAERAPFHGGAGRRRRAPRLAHALGALPAQGQRHGLVQRLRPLRRHPVVELGAEAADERGRQERVGDVATEVRAPPEDPLHAEVVPVDGLAGALPQRHELGARAVAGARRAEEVEEGGADGVPRRGRRVVTGARGREVVPQRGVAVERRREDAGGGRGGHGAVGAADAVEALDVDVGALAGVAAEDGEMRDRDVEADGVVRVRVGEEGRLLVD